MHCRWRTMATSHPIRCGRSALYSEDSEHGIAALKTSTCRPRALFACNMCRDPGRWGRPAGATAQRPLSKRSAFGCNYSRQCPVSIVIRWGLVSRAPSALALDRPVPVLVCRRSLSWKRRLGSSRSVGTAVTVRPRSCCRVANNCLTNALYVGRQAAVDVTRVRFSEGRANCIWAIECSSRGKRKVVTHLWATAPCPFAPGLNGRGS